MTPEALLGNLRVLLLTLAPALGGVAVVGAVVLYGVGKASGATTIVHWGKQAALGAIVLLGSSAVIGLLTNIAQRLAGVA